MTSVLVVGAGAVGGTLAGYLARADRDVTIVDGWPQHVEAIRRVGLHVTSPEEEFRVNVRALHLDELHSVGRKIGTLILATKAYDTEWAYRLARPYVAADATILSAQNGIMEQLLPRYADMRAFVGCVVNIAAECFEPGFVRRTLTRNWPALTVGELDGSMSDRVVRLAEFLEPVGTIVRTTNVIGALWSKLALNSMANAPGALTKATTSVLWGDDSYLPVALAASSETAAVAKAEGVDMDPVLGRIPAEDLLSAYYGSVSAGDRVSNHLRSVSDERRGARENKPSMLQDVLKGRRTEIEYLNGYVVTRGTQLGVATPMNARLAQLVREVDRGERMAGSHNLADLKAQFTRELAVPSGLDNSPQ